MAFFSDPFNDILNEEEMLKKIESRLKQISKDEVGTYIFVRGALENREKLRELFMESEEFPEKLRETYLLLDKKENEYISKLNELKSALEPEKPTSEAYHLANDILSDEEIRKRFEIDNYFPKRERIIYFHLEFLFNDNGNLLLDEVLPRLSKIKTKNIFSLFRFKLFDIGCYTGLEEEDDLDTKKSKIAYINFCEKCIGELIRFGNMREKEGVFFPIGIDEGKEKLFNLSIRLLLTLFEVNISNYLQLEVTKEETLFAKEIEKGFELIEYAKRVKKPLVTFEDAKELVEKLEKLRRLVEYANEFKLLFTPQEKRLDRVAEELIDIVEKAQKEYLKEDIFRADQLNVNGETSFDSVEEEDNSNIISLRKEFIEIEKLIGDVKRSRAEKREKIERLIKESEYSEPFYYEYINRTLYVMKFFRFNISTKMRDFLVETDQYGGSSYQGEDPLERFYNREESIKEYLDGTFDMLNRVYKKQFASLKRFDDGFELSKQINSILLKLASTIKELNG